MKTKLMLEGEWMFDNVLFCPFCGTKLTHERVTDSQSPKVCKVCSGVVVEKNPIKFYMQ